MKKNKLNTTERKAVAKRGQKRNERLKKTRKEKHVKSAKILADKKAKERKFNLEMAKLIESRYAK